MIALISDIHANMEALTAVLADIDSRGGGDMIYCLGDIVGYGPEPEACVDLVRERCCVHLMGNHDNAMLNGAVGFNVMAAGAIDYHRSLMEPAEQATELQLQRWGYVKSLEENREDGEFFFVHASPRDHLNEYILPSDPEYDPDKVAAIFERVAQVCFVGHSHLPGVVTPEPRFQVPEDLGGQYEFDKSKAVVNIGSVGQPRDADPRACYVEFDENGVCFRRVEYDFEETYRKIREIPELDDRLGERLTVGR